MKRDNAALQTNYQGLSGPESGFSARLLSLLEEKSISQADLVRMTGESRSSISAYCSGRMPGGAAAIRLAEALDVRPAWLVLGHGDRFERAPEAQGDHTVPVLDVVRALETDLWYDLRVFDGNLLLDDQMLLHLGRQDTRGLVCILHDGDANLPLIADGAPVIVDTLDTRLREAMFAYRVGPDLFVRRLQRSGMNEVTAAAENPRYEPHLFAGETRNHLAIIGRVIATLTRL